MSFGVKKLNYNVPKIQKGIDTTLAGTMKHQRQESAKFWIKNLE